MHRLPLITVVVLGTLILSGCSSSSDPRSSWSGPRFVVVDHQASQTGGSIPSWVTERTAELEAGEEFRGVYVFKFEEFGEDLAELEAVVDRRDVPCRLAQFLSARVRGAFIVTGGLPPLIQKYLDQVLESIEAEKITDYHTHGEYWVAGYFTEDDGAAGPREYRLSTIYTVEWPIIDRILGDAIDRIVVTSDQERSELDRFRMILEEEGF